MGAEHILLRRVSFPTLIGTPAENRPETAALKAGADGSGGVGDFGAVTESFGRTEIGLHQNAKGIKYK